MKVYYALLLSTFFLLVTQGSGMAQCPRLAGIMVDACSTGPTENRNEFVFCLNGNSSLNVNDLNMSFPANAAIGAGSTDFAPNNAGVAPIGSCLQVLDDGDVIPANAPFIIFMSSNVAVAYDFSSWCTQYGTVYLLYKTNPAPTTATFLNETPTPGIQRSVIMSVTGSPVCTASYTYDVLVGSGVSADGNFYRFPVPTAGVSLSPGFVNNGCASPPFEMLPVTLESFTAGIRNGEVQLSWSTATELNASHFEILKSTDGINYSTIGSVSANGNSNSVMRYSYADKNYSENRIYYRLKMVDLDGSSELSKIISIRANANGNTLNNLYPNPATAELIIEWNGSSIQKTQVSIRNLQGQLLQTTTITTLSGFNQLKLNTSQLSAGQYFITLDFGTDNIVQAFLKQ